MEPAPERSRIDAALELGLASLLILAPLPFGAVGPRGRGALELGAFALLLVWAARAVRRPAPLPPRTARFAVIGLLALALVQALPLGSTVVGGISPSALEIRRASGATGEALEAERRLLSTDPSAFDSPATLSVDPAATASALRTGAMMAALFFVACTVAATRGARGLALALLLSASFQGLYGMVVLASKDPHIWYRAKQHYLESATGTFINRNHFACSLAMSLACGLALILHDAARARPDGGRPPLARLFGRDNSRNLVLGLLLVVGLAGLLASLSRAGITLGLLALVLTLLAAGRFRKMRLRLTVALIVLTAAALPLVQTRFDRLAERYASSAQDLVATGGRAQVWQDTLQLVSSFPAVGSGFGTFATAYPLVRSPEVRKFFAHAHNDALQAAAEGGLIGLVLLGAALVSLGQRMWRALTGDDALAVGLAAALIAVLLHALVDFNFHIPANGATAAALAGALLGLPCERRTSG